MTVRSASLSGNTGSRRRAVVAAAGLLGAALPLQYTLSLGDTAVRLCLADPLLLAASPFLCLYFWRHRRGLLDMAGTPLLLAVFACTGALALSLAIGHAQLGGWSGWALVKFAGWFVLLAYAGFAMALAETGGAAAILAFIAGVLGTQFAAFLAYLASVTLALGWSVQSGPRLQGWADNANAMTLQTLIGLALAVGFNGCIRRRLGGVLAAAIPAVLAGMVLLTRSVAGLITLPLLFGAMALWQPARSRRLLLIVVGAGVVWLAPQVVGSNSGFNVFDKLIAVLAPDVPSPGIGKEHERTGMKELTLGSRTRSYSLAIEQWKSRPLTGAGLGTHLAAQKSADPAAPPVQIHNSALWLAAETGLLGLGAFSALFVILALRLWRAAAGASDEGGAARAMAISALLALAAAVAMSLFHELLYQRMLWAVLGAALAFGAPVRGQSGRSARETSSR